MNLDVGFPSKTLRLAFVVSHPIQYYVPLYRHLTGNDEVQIKVFYTWHGGTAPVHDKGFGRSFAWDIPLTDGYEFEVVPNVARDPGTHHFWGLRNPGLIGSILRWKPNAAVITGYPYASHLAAIRGLPAHGVPVLFRGDSHLLDRQAGWKSLVKGLLLRRVFRWPSGFLCVGRHNKDYYRAFGVPEERLFTCPHSIEVERFAEPDAEWEAKAVEWRRELNVDASRRVMLFAGKFEDKKRPVALMRAMLEWEDPRWLLVMVGDGALGDEVRRMAAQAPERFRLLPFQNQSRMPVVYRLGDLLVLPSAYGETWGLAVNEALACGRPVLVSDKVGCAPDLVTAGHGAVFHADDWKAMRHNAADMFRRIEAGGFPSERLRRETAAEFSIPATSRALLVASKRLMGW